MCGIAGVVASRDPSQARDAVFTMTEALSRRGPDGQGVQSWPSAVLGHRRLAIFDLSPAGSQPMLSPDGSVGVVFNGAIYNFPELKSELIREGHEFRTRTDTEVLVNGYLEWGPDLLIEKLIGMFAFALWDDRAAKLWLVRDRLGVKPLVYAERDGTIAFASTVRALRAAGYARTLNETAIVDFLRFGFVPDEEAIYLEPKKVPAATVVEWSGGRLRQRTYWKPPAVGQCGAISFRDAVGETERLLLQAVAARLNADVPVGALLSGGIDSALVCWAIAKLGGDVTAYTIGTPGGPWDETANAVETARRLGLRHRVLTMSGSDPLDVGELASAYAEPLACGSALGMLRASRAAASSAKVLLTGDGGDDVFLGYPRHRHLALAGRVSERLPTAFRKAWRATRPLVPRAAGLRRAASLLDYAAGGLDAYLAAAPGLRPYLERGLLGRRLLDAPASPCTSPSGIPPESSLEAYLEYERGTRFVAEYMTKVDGATMHYGLEARSPFLDQRVWEFASSLPFDVRLRGYRLKAVLRELARRRLGARVAVRRKRGFGVPAERWIVGPWREKLRSILDDSELVRQELIRAQPLRAMVNSSDPPPEVAWSLVVLEAWLAKEAATAGPGVAARTDSLAAVAAGPAV
jgi:asparagine synthase (glutamine-hydrolysing)